MAQYRCAVCGYVHDEQKEGTRWGDLPDDWTCPICGAAKSEFAVVPAESDVRPQQAAPGPASVARRRKAGVPSAALMAHRVFGYIFFAIFLLLLVRMLPRLWNYQIEFPARTVVHISLAMAVGVMLVLKITIVRFFRRLDPALAPLLGTSVLVASVVLIGIAVPSALREAWATTRLFGDENRERVRVLLVQAGAGEAESARLASAQSLRAGREVLRQVCVECHDLRTVLARPRTPTDWRRTVGRMAERTTQINPLSEQRQWQVTAYLVALSPDLQRSARSLRETRDLGAQSREAARAVAAGPTAPTTYDPAAAKRLFEAKCSQCHKTDLVAAAVLGSDAEVRRLVAAMIEEGLSVTKEETAQIVRYLNETYVKKP